MVWERLIGSAAISRKLFKFSALLTLSFSCFATEIGEPIEGSLTVALSNGTGQYQIPLPNGEWVLAYKRRREALGSTAALTDFGLLKMERGELTGAIEITAQVDGKSSFWSPEECRINNIIVSMTSPEGSKFFRCVTISHTSKFLKNESEPTREALRLLERNKVSKPPSTSIVISVIDANKKLGFFSFKQHLFPPSTKNDDSSKTEIADFNNALQEYALVLKSKVAPVEPTSRLESFDDFSYYENQFARAKERLSDLPLTKRLAAIDELELEYPSRKSELESVRLNSLKTLVENFVTSK